MRVIERQKQILGRVRLPWAVGKAADLTPIQKALAQSLSNRERQGWAESGYSAKWLDRLMDAEAQIERRNTS